MSTEVRIAAQDRVEIVVHDFTEFLGEYAPQLSHEGVLILTDEPLEAGSDAVIRFELEDGYRLIEARGRVAWSHRAAEGSDAAAPGMGVRFIEVDEAGRELIDRIVENHRRAGGEPFDVDGAAPRPPAPPAQAVEPRIEDRDAPDWRSRVGLDAEEDDAGLPPLVDRETRPEFAPGFGAAEEEPGDAGPRMPESVADWLDGIDLDTDDNAAAGGVNTADATEEAGAEENPVAPPLPAIEAGFDPMATVAAGAAELGLPEALTEDRATSSPEAEASREDDDLDLWSMAVEEAAEDTAQDRDQESSEDRVRGAQPQEPDAGDLGWTDPPPPAPDLLLPGEGSLEPADTEAGSSEPRSARTERIELDGPEPAARDADGEEPSEASTLSTVALSNVPELMATMGQAAGPRGESESADDSPEAVDPPPREPSPQPAEAPPGRLEDSDWFRDDTRGATPAPQMEEVLAGAASSTSERRSWLPLLVPVLLLLLAAAAFVSYQRGAFSRWLPGSTPSSPSVESGDTVSPTGDSEGTTPGPTTSAAPAPGEAPEPRAANDIVADASTDGRDAAEVGEASGTPTATAVPATSDSRADRGSTVVDAVWSVEAGQTLVTLRTDGRIDASRIRRERLTGDRPREVVKLRGMSRPFAQSALEVGSAEVERVRFGYHQVEDGEEQHVVLDLAAPEVRVNAIEVQQDRIVLRLGRG